MFETISFDIFVAADAGDSVVVDGPAFVPVGEDGDEDEDDVEDANENRVIHIESGGKRAKPKNTLDCIPGIVPLVPEVDYSVGVDGTASGLVGEDNEEDEGDGDDEDDGNRGTWQISRCQQMTTILPFSPNPDMVDRYGPYVRCKEVPCKALFLGNDCKKGKMIPT